MRAAHVLKVLNLPMQSRVLDNASAVRDHDQLVDIPRVNVFIRGVNLSL